MKDKSPDIIIDGEDPIAMFLPPSSLKVGDKVLIQNDGGLFPSHPARRDINGIMPSNNRLNLNGKIMTVLSTHENLGVVPVVVLTDGEYGYWFSYETVHEKKYLQLIP